MSSKVAVACLRAARKCYTSESRRETYIAAAFAVVGAFLLYQTFGGPALSAYRELRV